MGTSYQVNCAGCGYTADVCGRSAGMSVALLPHPCNDCHAVVDVVIEDPVGQDPESGVRRP